MYGIITSRTSSALKMLRASENIEKENRLSQYCLLLPYSMPYFYTKNTIHIF